MPSLEGYHLSKPDHQIVVDDNSDEASDSSMSLTCINSDSCFPDNSREAAGTLISLAFLDFDLSMDGILSVFPQAIQIPKETGPSIVGGIGAGERVFLPPNGLTSQLGFTL